MKPCVRDDGRPSWCAFGCTVPLSRKLLTQNFVITALLLFALTLTLTPTPQRGGGNMDNMLSLLEKKYGGAPAGTSGGKGRGKRPPGNEPTDEEFEAARARMDSRKAGAGGSAKKASGRARR